MNISIKTYSSKTPGKHLLVLGAIHGNEVCGPHAINRVIQELDSGFLKLEEGFLTLIPVCNERAYQQNVRYTEENLNRIFSPHRIADTYEATLVDKIMPYIDSCDILLDIHSFHTPGVPFVFQDAPQAEAFALSLQFPIVITGWPEVYSSNKDKNEGDTVGYALQQGKEAVLIECGQHTDPDSVERAYAALRNALSYAGLSKFSGKNGVIPSQTIHMRDVFFKKKEGGFIREWQHGDIVRKNETIAIHADGTKLNASSDGFILLPKMNAQIGEEWFYFGTERS